MAQFNSFDGSGQQAHYNYRQAGASPGPTPLQRLLVLVGIIVGVIILIVVFFSLIGGSESSGPSQDLSRITARHENTLSLITTYEKNIRSLETQNETARIRAVLLSDLNTLQSVGATSAASAVTDSTIASQLDSAAASTNFDSVFSGILEDELVANTTEIQALYNNTSNTKLREALNTAFINQTALIE